MEFCKIKKIVILGSTGSIGINTLKVVQNLGKNFHIVGLAAGKNIDLLAQQIEIFHPPAVAVGWPQKVVELKRKIPHYKGEIFSGVEGLIKLATLPEANFLVSALGGTVGLKPTLAAIKAKKTIALANKEILVMAGRIIMEEVAKYNVSLLPLDSEHSAIFQVLRGGNRKDVRRIILTASGGPFLKHSQKQLARVTLRQTLTHPTWNMGRKITVDSATLMNKGFEIIEASYFFEIPIDKIEVVIHPESIIHSMVEFVDGAVMAQLGVTDMYLPIQYALTFPDRKKTSQPFLDFHKVGKLTFTKPNYKKFPCLQYAYFAGKIGGTMPAVLSASDEIAVENFLNSQIAFNDITKIIEYVMLKHRVIKNPTLDEILQVENWAKKLAKDFINKLSPREPEGSNI